MAFPTGETAALITSLLWALSSTLFAIGTRRHSPQAVNRLRLLGAFLLLSLTFTITQGGVVPPGGGRMWFYLGLSGVVGLAIGDSFLFYSYRMIGPRLSMLLMSLAPVVTTSVAWVYMGEGIEILKLLAVGITLLGVGIVVLERGDEDSPSPRSRLGILVGVGAMLGQAGGLLLAKVVLDEGYPTLPATYIRVTWGTVAVWSIGLITGGLKEVYPVVKDRGCLKTTAMATFLGPYLGIWLSLIAVSYAKIGIASTLMSLSPIFIIPLSTRVFGERVGARAILGTLLATAGVAGIFLL
ncbi:MAG: DMT family transporter [Thermoplasmata archaeon]|nr:DMT family transporter [Thermoplasmata archaeon]